MTNPLLLFWQCVVGPKLYQIYPSLLPSSAREVGFYEMQIDHIYIKNTIETLSDNILFVVRMFTFEESD